MRISLDTPIKELYSVGQTTYKRLERLGLQTVQDLLFYYPSRYEDYSTITSISDLEIGQQTSIEAKIEVIKNKRSFRRRAFVTHAIVSDESGQMPIVWFNQKYLTKTLHEGMIIRFAGKVVKAYEGYGVQMTNPTHELSSKEETHTGRLVPVYSVTTNLSQKQLRFLTKQALEAAPLVDEFLPDQILESGYANIQEALSHIHFPEDWERLNQAKHRLKFQELFLLQLKIMKAKARMQEETAKSLVFHQEKIKTFVDTLPFTLTDDQKKCAYQIMIDLQQTLPMNRLLEGDVGSGKTIVALLSAYFTYLNEGQTVFLCPTEILAKQHFATLQTFLKEQDINIGLATRTQYAYCNPALDSGVQDIKKEEMAKKCAKGTIDILVATHTVLQEQYNFKNLLLVVVDEQHRFGVNQRKLLRDKCRQDGYIPHFLSMTATPIPRSLALILYGDLSISILRTKPKGRKPIITKLVLEDKKDDAMTFIKKELDAGRQAFVIAPLIDVSDTLGVKSVKEAYEELKNTYFPDYEVEMLHGKLKTKEKDRIMGDFSKGKIHILVSTAVVEVGVDVPNATVMGIMGAQRFGLASLHQFRGRVGRSDLQSYCFLFPDNLNERSKERLKYMENCFDGFDLAKKDLEMRGPGDVYGHKQSGLPEFKIASIFDAELVADAQNWAQKVVSDGLEHYTELQARIDDEATDLHLE